MNPDNKKRVRKEVERGNWTIIWIGADMPCEFLNEKVELMYEDMDGQPCICEAVYTHDKNAFTHTPYFKRTDGARMMNCIAWRKANENY